jgi:dihydropteroate synthase
MAGQTPAAPEPPTAPPGLSGLPRLPRALVMGVVNVTPDSFSDGGSWMDPRAAVRHGRELADGGADLVDVGGESTRPGAQRIDAAEELRRVIPVITELAAAGLRVSADTTRACVARQALDAGAVMVNDVSGGLADPEMAAVVAAAGVPYVVTHWRAPSADMYGPAVYGDVVADVRAELGGRVAAVIAAGVDRAQVIVDPGLGFAKRGEHNWALLAALAQLARLPGQEGRFPLLIGASRKSFIGHLLADAGGPPRPFAGRDDATIALTALAAAAGAWGVRVHAVPGNADAVRVAARWRAATLGEAGTVAAAGTATAGAGAAGTAAPGEAAPGAPEPVSAGLGWPR